MRVTEDLVALVIVAVFPCCQCFLAASLEVNYKIIVPLLKCSLYIGPFTHWAIIMQLVEH